MRKSIVGFLLSVSWLLAPNDVSQACTSLCLKTVKGTFFAANLDLLWGDGLVFANRRGIAKSGYLANTRGEPLKWTSKYGSLTFNLVGREFAWCGMNEAGLVVSTMFLDDTGLPVADERFPVVSGFWVQYLLDNCKSVSDAIAAVTPIRLADDKCHFLIADANGNCAAMEYLDGKLVIHTGEELPVTALTNNPYSVLLEDYRKNITPENDPFHSVQRFKNVAEKLADFNHQPDASPVEYLRKIVTQTVYMSDTKWSIVFDVEKRTIYFQTKDSPAPKLIRMDGFDLSCGAPFKMLDVNIQTLGDVTTRFVPYDHDRNLAVFSKFCERWGVDVSADNAKALISFLDGFGCVK